MSRRELAEKAGDAEAVTHTICPECKAAHFPALAEVLDKATVTKANYE